MNSDLAVESGVRQLRISGYKILREVGRGGIATVYLAVQESLQREVALKVMSPALTTDPNFTVRFMHEGRTIAQLNHPGIVTIYDISVADHQHYIAMEYLQGGSLKQRLRDSRPVHETLDILYQVASALAYAHDRGIVHRDVKPENIMFRGTDQSEAVLTDFGIAKSNARDTQLTNDGMVVGTPRYMSPEQAEGRGANQRSDIYALGVVLHEMLTGHPPFEAKESLAVLYSHINDPIPQLPENRRFLQPLLQSMLAKNPDNRIADCASLLERIEVFHTETMRITHGVGQGDPPPTPPPHSPSAVRKGLGVAAQWLAWGGVVLASVIIIGTVYWGVVESPVAIIGDDLPEGEAALFVAPTKVDLTQNSKNGAVNSDHGKIGKAKSAVDIDALLALAAKQVKLDRLTSPAGNNALDTYRAVLKVDPANAAAKGGLRSIADRYAELTESLMEARRYEQAALMVENGLSAWPKHDPLKRLSKQLDIKLAQTGADNDAAPIDKYVQSVAEEGYAEAQFQLALAFANGDGVVKDLDETLKWLRKAAGDGHFEARYNLGLGLLFGPQPDSAEASRVIGALAEDDYKPAYRVLGWMYTEGVGLRRSVKQAVRWSAKASSWREPPSPSGVVEPWQRSFEQAYQTTVSKVKDDKLRQPQNLK